MLNIIFPYTTVQQLLFACKEIAQNSLVIKNISHSEPIHTYLKFLSLISQKLVVTYHFNTFQSKKIVVMNKSWCTIYGGWVGVTC